MLSPNFNLRKKPKAISLYELSDRKDALGLDSVRAF